MGDHWEQSNTTSKWNSGDTVGHPFPRNGYYCQKIVISLFFTANGPHRKRGCYKKETRGVKNMYGIDNSVPLATIELSVINEIP